MKLYKLNSGTHARYIGETWTRFNEGDQIALSDEDAAQFTPGRLTPVGSVTQPTTTTAPVVDWAEVLGQNVTAVGEHIDSMNDKAAVASLLAAEEAAGARVGVVKHAQKRLAELG